MTTRRRPRICVLSGGPSGEAHASRVSASAVYNALVAAGMEVVWIDLRADGRWQLRTAYPNALPMTRGDGGTQAKSWQDEFIALIHRLEIDLVFPVMHGTIGEDGLIQTLCESIDVLHVGSDPAATLRCYDKVTFKRVVSSAGLPTADSFYVPRRCYETDTHAITTSVREEIDYPCIVKPSRSGSSLGLARVDTPEALPQALKQAFDFDDVVLIEQLIVGSDVEIGVCGNDSPTIGCPVEIECDAPLYNFAAKYQFRDSLQIPAKLPNRLTTELMRAAHVAFTSTDCRGMARVDFLVNHDTHRFVINELNTIPYMTAKSSFAESLCQVTGRSYESLVAHLVHLAWHSER